MNCTIQIGGSDQWGNILGGIDLINKLADTGQGSRNSTFGITTPLLTTSGGLKFSKSTGGAVWLDKSMSSYLDFYQVNRPFLVELGHNLIPAVFPEGYRCPSRKLAQTFHADTCRPDQEVDGPSSGQHIVVSWKFLTETVWVRLLLTFA